MAFVFRVSETELVKGHEGVSEPSCQWVSNAETSTVANPSALIGVHYVFQYKSMDYTGCKTLGT
jgi:hypothetical protein